MNWGLICRWSCLTRSIHKIPHIANILPSGKYPTECSGLWRKSCGEVADAEASEFDVMTCNGHDPGEKIWNVWQKTISFERNVGYLANYKLNVDDVLLRRRR